MKYVYILQSVTDSEHFYTGITDDLRARLAKHNAGEVFHTSKFAPWTIKTYVAFSDEKQAVAFEKYLKSASGRALGSVSDRSASVASDAPTPKSLPHCHAGAQRAKAGPNQAFRPRSFFRANFRSVFFDGALRRDPGERNAYLWRPLIGNRAREADFLHARPLKSSALAIVSLIQLALSSALKPSMAA